MSAFEIVILFLQIIDRELRSSELRGFGHVLGVLVLALILPVLAAATHPLVLRPLSLVVGHRMLISGSENCGDPNGTRTRVPRLKGGSPGR